MSNKTNLVYQSFELNKSFDKNKYVSFLSKVEIDFPLDYNEMRKEFKKRYPNSSEFKLFQLPIRDLRLNLNCLQYVLMYDEWKQNSNTFSCNAIKKIYFHQEKWEEKQQIGKSKYGKVKISDLLSVIDYAIKAVGLLSNIDTRNLEKGVLVLKSVNFAINQQEYEKPEIELTHLGVDLLASVAKDMTDNSQKHKMATVSSVLINSVVDFLTSE